jgi:hypothetical protein
VITNDNTNPVGDSSTTTTETINQITEPITSTHTAAQDNPNDYTTASFTATINVSNTLVLQIGTCCTGNPADDLDLFIENSSGVLVGVSASSSSEEAVALWNPPDDEYTIFVHGWDVPDGTTSFVLLQNLLPMPDAAPPGVYFTTTVEVTSTVALEISTCCSVDESDVDLYLLDSGGNVVGSSAGSSDDERIVSVTPPDDTYTILAVGAYVPNGTDTFDLTVSLTNSVGADLEWDIEEAPVACGTPSDISWVAAPASSGATDAGSTQNISIHFDAAGSAPGLYEGVLCLSSNDPDSLLVAVPISMLLKPPLFLPLVSK